MKTGGSAPEGHFMKNKILLLFVLFFLTATPFLPEAFAESDTVDLGKAVRRHTLSNGLRLLIAERHLSPTVSCYIRYKVGAVDERGKSTGTAHFLEHLLFKGTETIGTVNYEREKPLRARIRKLVRELDREKKKGVPGDEKKIESLAAEIAALGEEAARWTKPSEIDRLYTESGAVNLNASTGYDLTTYHVSLPANRLELWARIESDRMADAVFREFERERMVIEEERRQTVESVPNRRLVELFLGTAFMVHPYRRPIIGWPSSIPFLDIDYVERFYETYHVPNNAVIAVVGAVDPGQVLEIVERYFGRLPAREIPPRDIPGEPIQRGERRVEYRAPANPKIILGYHKPTLPSPDDVAFDLLDIVLTGGRTARLHRVLVEEATVASSVQSSSGFPGVRYDNLFTVFATPRSPHTLEELEKALLSELDRLKEEAVPEREIEKARNIYRAGLLREMRSNAGMAGLISYFEILTGDFRFLSEALEQAENVTAEDLKRIARTFFVDENRTVAILAGTGES